MKISEIKSLYEKHSVPPHIQAHMHAVGKYAKKLAHKAKKKNINVNRTAIYKASLLHDLFRLEPKHEKVIADYLEKLGHLDLSELVRYHGYFDADKLTTLEQKIVFYADKRVCEDKVVSLETRFSEAKKRKSIVEENEKTKKAEERIYQLENELTELLGHLPNGF